MNAIIYSLLTLGIMGLVAGGLLSYAAKRFSVPVDPRVERLAEVLPGANCGACSYASCTELAKAILKGEVSTAGCIAGGAEVARRVAEIVGKKPEEIKTPKVAVVQCRGGKNGAKERFRYTGIEDCSAAVLVAGGHKACIYGCLGLSSCVKICPFGAILVNPEGLPVIDEVKCTGCGKCVDICPRGIITLIPRDQKVFLACVSKDKAKKVKEVCNVGCITCGICTKPGIAPEGVIAIGENLPVIKWKEGMDLKKMLEEVVKKCPNQCFVVRD